MLSGDGVVLMACLRGPGRTPLGDDGLVPPGTAQDGVDRPPLTSDGARHQAATIGSLHHCAKNVGMNGLLECKYHLPYNTNSLKHLIHYIFTPRMGCFYCIKDT